MIAQKSRKEDSLSGLSSAGCIIGILVVVAAVFFFQFRDTASVAQQDAIFTRGGSMKLSTVSANLQQETVQVIQDMHDEVICCLRHSSNPWH